MYRDRILPLSQVDVMDITDVVTEMPKLHLIATNDAKILVQADQQYGSSWLKRGGTGAYIVGIRKADRMEQQLAKHGGNLRLAVQHDQRPEGIINDLRDLRRYFYLWEANAQELGFYATEMAHVVPELAGPLHPMEGLEMLVAQDGYDIFKTFGRIRHAVGIVRWWRRLLLRWEAQLDYEGLLPELTAMEQVNTGWNPDDTTKES